MRIADDAKGRCGHPLTVLIRGMPYIFAMARYPGPFEPESEESRRIQ
jgi:hypothetical protein